MLSDTTSRNIKIIDFGTSQVLRAGVRNGNLAGTPEFMSPEVVNYDDIYTQTDLWSVGVMIYVLLSGYSPFLDDEELVTLANVTRLTNILTRLIINN